MSMVINFAFGVDKMMFRSSLTVSMSIVGVPQPHGKLILLPPTVIRTLCGSSFFRPVFYDYSAVDDVSPPVH